MKARSKKLPNGLRVLVAHMPSVESATVTVWVRVGSRNENTKVNGISHFLEHMAFKGGKKYKSAQEVSETIDGIGGEFNAGTNKEWTNYYVKSRAADIDISLDVLSDMLLVPSLKQKDIDREKGVIVEEIGLYEDTPRRKVWDILEQVVYEGSLLAMDIIGTRKTVKAMTRRDFVNHINSNYVADNMLITISGGVKPKEAFAVAEKYFGKLARGKVKTAKKYRSKQKGPRVRVDFKDTEQANFVIAFPGLRMGVRDRYSMAVMTTILGKGMSSRLFSEIREKRGLAYSVSCGADAVTDTGYVAIYAGVDPEKAEEATRVILEQVYGFADGSLPVSSQELTKAKEFNKGHFALGLEDTRAVNSFLGLEKLLLGRVRTPKDVYKGLEKVSVVDVQRLAKKIFKPKMSNFAMIGPFKGDKKFRKLFSEPSTF